MRGVLALLSVEIGPTSGNVLAADYRAASTRELLTKRIIETARQGERDPIRLVDDALSYVANSN